MSATANGWNWGISVEVNHRLIDGVHIGRFAEKLTERINGLE